MTNREILNELELLSPPAVTINEAIEHIDMNLGTFAEQMEIPFWEAVELVTTDHPITEAIAEKLERVLKIDRSFWLARERDYQEKLEHLHRQLDENSKK